MPHAFGGQGLRSARRTATAAYWDTSTNKDPQPGFCGRYAAQSSRNSRRSKFHPRSLGLQRSAFDTKLFRVPNMAASLRWSPTCSSRKG
eukprot:2468512-Karenia_brevis.AAC.1